MRVFINPGHAPNSDPDPGAVNHKTGLQEADVAARVGALVLKYLVNAGCDCRLAQIDSLRAICEQSNRFDADIFVSIHCNSAAVESAHGTETFHWNGSVNGQKLAECIQNQIVNSLPVADRGIKTANFQILRDTDAVACLVEMAFISNDKEAEMLADERYQDEFARAIARGVTDYISA
jgi:N-acetylmuramoyl-L-alanine amidase